MSEFGRERAGVFKMELWLRVHSPEQARRYQEGSQWVFGK